MYKKFTITTEYFRCIEPYLNKYFGISYGYFEQEVNNQEEYFQTPIEIGESPTLKFFEGDYEFLLITKFDFDQITPIAEILQEEEQDDVFEWILLLLAYVIKEQDWNWQYDLYDFKEYGDYDLVRKDLLKLYIFINQKQPRTADARKLTLKHSLDKIDIENYDNWFTQNLLKDYLTLYLSDVHSVEQAEEELKTYKKKAGRKASDPRIPAILYGLFRIVNDHEKTTSPQSDALCEFIITYLQFLGLIEEDTHIDNQWIRAQINYIKTRPEPPKLEFRDVAYRCSLEELKGSGKRLY